MLPPQLRPASARSSAPAINVACRAASSAGLRRSVLSGATRSFWGRRTLDWSCPTDPGYQRFHRIRTLKTRAKLLEKIRRRGKFEWAPDQAEFFSPKAVRWASHSHRGRRVWPQEEEGSPEKAKDEATTDAAEAHESDYELSQREKQWHKQIEDMRRRIELDPYEAVFGKRFEPFWSPLVPSYMREEMGLQNWSKQKDAAEVVQEDLPVIRQQPNPKPEKSVKSGTAATTETTTSPPVGVTAASISHTVISSTSEDPSHPLVEERQISEIYSYDPISNRMVRVTLPKPAETVEPSRSKLPSGSPTQSTTPAEEAVEKPASGMRKSIPIPVSGPVPPSSNNMRQTSDSPNNSNAASSSPSRPAILAKLPEDDLDLMTADHVRAAMGKTKLSSSSVGPSTPQEKAELERDFDERIRNDTQPQYLQPSLDRLQSKEQPQPVDPDDSAAHESTEPIETTTVPKDWLKQADLLQADRVRRTAGKQRYPMTRWIDDMEARKAKFELEQEKLRAARAEANAAHDAVRQKMDARLQAEVDEQKLQMEAHELRSGALLKAITAEDEATRRRSDKMSELITRMKTRFARQLAERLAGRNITLNEHELKEFNGMQTEWKAIENEVEQARYQGTVQPVSRLSQLERLSKELVAARKLADDRQAATEKQGKAYKDKIKSLRGELETAYKQSVLHSEKHLERIKNLENDLAESRKLVSSHAASIAASNDIVRATDDLRQAAMLVDKQLERIRSLAHDFGKTPTSSDAGPRVESGIRPSSAESMKSMQAEGDFCPNITKFADSSKWYKRPASGPGVQPPQHEVSKAEHKTPDQQLVAEVKRIYEQRYGTIDATHRQSSASSPSLTILEKLQQARSAARKHTQVVEVESDVDLGDELARYESEKQQPYEFRPDGLEKELRASTEPPDEAAGDIDLYEKLEKGEPYRFRADATEGKTPAKRESLDLGRSDMAEYEKLEKHQQYRFEDDDLQEEIKARTQPKMEAQAQPDDEMAAYISRERGRPYRFRPESSDTGSIAQTGTRDEMAEYVRAEKGQPYRFRPDGLEREIKERTAGEHTAGADEALTARSAVGHEANAAPVEQPESSATMESVTADTVKPTNSTSLTSATRGEADLTAPRVQWVEPPKYKTVVYKAKKKAKYRTTTTKTTPFTTGKESPLPIEHGLSQLSPDAPYTWVFFHYEKKGYHLVHASNNLLVFRKFHLDTSTVSSLADHGVSPGKATTDARAQREPSHLPEQTDVNPIDGTRASPATGNFASPTGFVNYDSVAEIDTPALSDPPAPAAAKQDGGRPVRRLERHFTGTLTTPVTAGSVAGNERRQSASKARHQPDRSTDGMDEPKLREHERDETREERWEESQDERSAKRTGERWEAPSDARRRHALSYAGATGLGAAAVMYLVGAAAEKAKERDGPRGDEWTRRAEESRKRWEGARG